MNRLTLRTSRGGHRLNLKCEEMVHIDVSCITQGLAEPRESLAVFF